MIESTVLNTEPYPKIECAVLELYYQNKPLAISPEQTPFHIGRENPDAGLSVTCEFASRQHCSIEFHGGKFVLKDFSRNGTYVQLSRTQTFRLLNEEAPLIGSGCFKLGAEIHLNDPEQILFKINTKPRSA